MSRCFKIYFMKQFICNLLRMKVLCRNDTNSLYRGKTSLPPNLYIPLSGGVVRVFGGIRRGQLQAKSRALFVDRADLNPAFVVFGDYLLNYIMYYLKR